MHLVIRRLALALLLLSSSFAYGQEDTFTNDAVGPVTGPGSAIVLPPSEDLQDVLEKRSPQTVGDLLAIERHVTQLAEKLQPATVGVRIGRAQGSGVIVTEDGYVLTAAHVVGSPGRKVTFILHDGREVKGESLGMNRSVDAGMMKITTEGEYPFVEMADVDELDEGDWTVALGHPGGYKQDRPPVVRLGRVVLKRNTVVQTDNALVGGDSGGPLFDMSGRVVGIHSRIGPSITWNFHVPVSAYTEDWDRLAKGDSWGSRPGRKSKAVLGVNGDDHPRGCKVTGVPDGYPAAEAGVQEGDVITKLNGEAVEDFEDLAERISEMEPGEEVELEILRGGETLVKKAKLAKRT